MRMFGERIDRETPELHEEGVRMRFIGRREGIEPALVERIEWAERLTDANDRITLFVAFNHGGRAEILDAARDSPATPRRTSAGCTPEMHDPDLLIRTSGERRISNYLLWQCAYPSSCSATSCGRTSDRRRSAPRSTSSRRARDASGPASG